MSKARRAVFAAISISWILSCMAGCAAQGRRPHEGIRAHWDDYSKLARHRAFAIAGDPDRAWVGARVGGYETSREAQQAALSECAKRRRDRRFQAPCRLYAVGNEVVW